MIPLFHPYVPEDAKRRVADVLGTRWIGQGPLVDEFEKKFQEKFMTKPAVMVNSGTAALKIAYEMVGIMPGDEVITPVLTCAATNIPLAKMGAQIVYADILPSSLNIDPDDVRRKITDKTKAIVVVHYGGNPADISEIQAIADEHHIPVIEDAAHALGASYKGISIGSWSDYTCFSFQAIKHITTGDGGMITFSIDPMKDRVREAKLRRWFGQDRDIPMLQRDVELLGDKLQPTDIDAAMGLAGLEAFSNQLNHRHHLDGRYRERLKSVLGLSPLPQQHDRTSACWMFLVLAQGREDLSKKLKDFDIESSVVHIRNDQYALLGGRTSAMPGMDSIEHEYLALPLHMHMTVEDVDMVCDVIQQGW